MKFLAKLGLTIFPVFILVIIGILGWLSLYQGDLPDVGLFAKFAPDIPGVASDPCLSRPVTVVPAGKIAEEMREAIRAAESEKILPFQVARFLLCGWQRYGNLRYTVDQYRLVWHLRWRFSKDQVLTIYMNRVYFGDDTFGVADAARRFFGKQPKDLNIPEAALLAGMIRAPDRFSPYKYPDAALQRRNQVIEAMLAQGAAGAEEASKAESAPIGALPTPIK